MASTSNISITGTITDLPTGAKQIGPIVITSAASLGQETVFTLASGTNTVTVPAAAVGCIIVFDTTSAVTKTLKGVAGDTGILLKPTGANVLNFTAGGVASFVITASAADTGLFTSILFF